jgi:hypothetical protein
MTLAEGRGCTPPTTVRVRVVEVARCVGKFGRLSAAVDVERRPATKQRLEGGHVPEDLARWSGSRP